MAGVYVSLVIQGASGLDPSAKLVLIVLAEFAQVKDNGLAYPSVGRIARTSGVCESQVRAHLRTLQAAEWIAPEGATHGGRGMSTRYRLNLPKLRAIQAKGHGRPSGISENKPDDKSSGIVPLNAPTGHRVMHKVNPMVDAPKPDGPRSETQWPAIGEKVLNDIKRYSRATNGNPVASLRDVLNPLKKSQTEKGNGDDRESDEKPRSQAEQIAWIQKQMAAGKH